MARDPLFADAIWQARCAAREETADRVRSLAPRALSVLDEVLANQTALATTRSKAAEIVLRRALNEPDEQDPPSGVRQHVDPLAAAMDEVLGREPTGEILWPAPEPNE